MFSKKIFHPAVAAFCAFLVVTPVFAKVAQPASEKDRMPSKSEVLDAIAVFEKNTQNPEAMTEGLTTILGFVVGSPDVFVTFGAPAVPWFSDATIAEPMGPQNIPKWVLAASYCAGNIQTQLKSGKTQEDPYTGWLFAIRTYRLLQSGQNSKVDIPYLDQLDKLQSRGWLKEYADYVAKEISAVQVNQKKSAQDAAPAGKTPKLTRNDLDAARRLRGEKKLVEACAGYEAWLGQNPDDADAHAELAYTLTLRAAAETSTERAAGFTRAARPHALKAFAFGSADPLLPAILESTAPGYKPAKGRFSENKKAQAQVELAEKAFAQHRYDEALKYYQQALRHDPKSYTATLFSGDCYYVLGKHSEAIEWFGKAIALNPDIETAHRYMADALRKAKKYDEAFAKYIDAFIAEPYTKLPRSVLQSVASSRNRLFKPSPLARLPYVPVVVTADKKIELGIRPSDNNKMIMAYAISRAGWRMEKGPAHFGEGVTPRHCAAEESEGLRAFAEIVLIDNEKKDAEASEWLAVAVEVDRLNKAGLLEAAIYLDRPTKEIAEDYPAYRAAHRDLLVRYLRERWYGEESGQRSSAEKGSVESGKS